MNVTTADQWPESSGDYVCWIQGMARPIVCYCNTRDKVWSRDGVRVQVTHYENRKLRSRNDVL